MDFSQFEPPEAVKRELLSAFPASAFLVTGSVARGVQSSSSDIDLLGIAGSRADYFRLLEIAKSMRNTPSKGGPRVSLRVYRESRLAESQAEDPIRLNEAFSGELLLTGSKDICLPKWEPTRDGILYANRVKWFYWLMIAVPRGDELAKVAGKLLKSWDGQGWVGPTTHRRPGRFEPEAETLDQSDEFCVAGEVEDRCSSCLLTGLQARSVSAVRSAVREYLNVTEDEALNKADCYRTDRWRWAVPMIGHLLDEVINHGDDTFSNDHHCCNRHCY